MVMMHELAHCVEMNHKAAFWKVNSQYKTELRALWARDYTGDGLWGRGRTLLSGGYHTGGRMENEILPANLCGGTFRSSRRRKRKRGLVGFKETYAEAQQRRIAKKFGMNGKALGEDEEAKLRLEKGKKSKGKPRVAGSARGRDLRAAAALARFDQVKEGQMKDEDEEEESLFGDSESETDSDESRDVGEAAFNGDGSRIKDEKGRGMFKVCESEDQNDVNVKRELDELRGLDTAESLDGRPPERPPRSPSRTSSTQPSNTEVPGTASSIQTSESPNPSSVGLYDIPQYIEKRASSSAPRPKINTHKRPTPTPTPTVKQNKNPPSPPTLQSSHDIIQQSTDPLSASPSVHTQQQISLPAVKTTHDSPCPICSMSNEPGSHLCIACSHVLDTDKVPKYWRCSSDVCQGSQYRNAADCGICGVCRVRRAGGGVGVG